MKEQIQETEATNQLQKFKPQKIVSCNNLLPYSPFIHDEALNKLNKIKENLSKSVILRDIRPGAIHWISALRGYIKLYGLYFTKEDHILLVKLVYELIIIPDQDFWITAIFCQVLSILLKKQELLSPKDIELKWKPLADLQSKFFQSSYKKLGMLPLPHNAESILKHTIQLCRNYFAPEATSEILEKIRPEFCPFDIAMERAFQFLELFLPTFLTPDRIENGWKLWLDEFIGLFLSYPNGSIHCHLLEIFSRLSWHNIGHIDWEPYLSSIFTTILNVFDLPVSYKHMSGNGFNSMSESCTTVALFIVSNLGGESKTQTELDRLFKILDSYYHPSNFGRWTHTLNRFLSSLTELFVNRLHNERYKKKSWRSNIKEEKKLTDIDIKKFVECVQPATMLCLFSKTGSHEAGKIFHCLALLKPEIVIPPLLEQLYSSLNTMTEPHRLIACLSAFVNVIRPLILGGKVESPKMWGDFPEEWDVEAYSVETTLEAPKDGVLTEKKCLQGQKVGSYPDGPTHVIPLLFQSLPGIDPNDMAKCMVTFQFISGLVAFVPLVDCSAAVDQVDDLTEIEIQICYQTAEFENFVLEFMNKSLNFIQSLVSEQSSQAEHDKDSMNYEQLMVDTGLYSAFKLILIQSHPRIFDAALDRLLVFTKGKCLESEVSGRLLGTMWKAAAKIGGEKTLKAFLPHVCRLILTLVKDDDCGRGLDDDATPYSDRIDQELLFNMLLLSELVQCKGFVVVKFLPEITEVLNKIIYMKNKKGYKMATLILRNLFTSLNASTVENVKSFVEPWDTSFSQFLPIRHWGEAANPKNKIEWCEPSAVQLSAVEDLVRTLLHPELICIRKFVKEGCHISRDRLHHSLVIIQEILHAGAAFPVPDDDLIKLVDMEVNRYIPELKLRSYDLEVTLNDENSLSTDALSSIGENSLKSKISKDCETPVPKNVNSSLLKDVKTNLPEDGKNILPKDCFPSNVRSAVSETILSLVSFLLESGSDDFKAMNLASSIFSNLLFFHGVQKFDVDARWRSLEKVKRCFNNSIVKKKQSTRVLVIERAMLQYDFRLLEAEKRICYTKTHERILHSLFKLSTSRYSEVRWRSQGILSQLFRTFPYSFKRIIPNVIQNLKKDPVENHKEFKGTLYVILGRAERTLAVRRDWSVLAQLWPALLTAIHSEKLSILYLYSQILKNFNKHFDFFAIENPVIMAMAVNSAYNLLQSVTKSSKPENVTSRIEVSPVHVTRCVEKLEKKNATNLESYKTLIHDLANFILGGKLHWRRLALCVHFLGKLIRHDITFPALGVEALLNQTLNDNIAIRKIVFGSIVCLLKNQKRPVKKIKIDPELFCKMKIPEKILPGDSRLDNKCMQYNKDSLNMTENEWNEKFFIHSTYVGWYCWPKKEMEVYAPAKEQPQINREFLNLSAEEKVFYNFFLNEKNVEKFIDFLSLEENREHDKFFLLDKFRLFKGLSQNFGTTFLPLFKSRMLKLASEPQESHQRCAAEMLAGLVRGAKHWPYKESKEVLDTACEVFEIVLSKIMNETRHDWSKCLTEISADRDPNQLAPLVELFSQNLAPQGQASFLASCRLDLARMFLGQQEWRISTVNHQILEDLKPHLSSSYKTIRDNISCLLQKIFVTDESIPNFAKTLSPHISDFIDYVLPLLSPLIQENGSGGGGRSTPQIMVASPSSRFDPNIEAMGSMEIAMEVGQPMVKGDLAVRLEEPESEYHDSPKDHLEERDHHNKKNEPMTTGPIEIKKGQSAINKEKMSEIFGSPNSGSFLSNTDTEEKKVSMRLMNTLCRFILDFGFCTAIVPIHFYRLLPHLCNLESIDSDMELRTNCLQTLADLSRAIVAPKDVDFVIDVLNDILQKGWWRAKISVLSFIQSFVFHNMFSIVKRSKNDAIRQMIFAALSDERTEVRQMAGQVLAGIIHTNFIEPDQKLIKEFTSKLNKSSKNIKTGAKTMTSSKHFGALGLCALVAAFPYDVPDFMPDVLITLSEHSHDPQPISTDIKQTLSNFKRTHHDNWQQHKTKFNSDQLAVLYDVLVSPSYYA